MQFCRFLSLLARSGLTINKRITKYRVIQKSTMPPQLMLTSRQRTQCHKRHVILSRQCGINRAGGFFLSLSIDYSGDTSLCRPKNTLADSPIGFRNLPLTELLRKCHGGCRMDSDKKNTRCVLIEAIEQGATYLSQQKPKQATIDRYGV